MSRAVQFLRSSHVPVAALIAAAVLLGVPAGASAASPVLEFVVPGYSLPVSFTNEGGEVLAEMEGLNTVVHCAGSHGEGKITGPRSTISNYVFIGCVTQGGTQGGKKCKSEGASHEEEIITGPIAAELVFISQAKHEVGVLLDPSGGTYIAFECGAETAEGRGPFLAPVGPINKEAMSFTASLSESGKVQTPDEYENANGEKLKAIPKGKVGSGGNLVATGVELSFTVHPGVSLEIKAITAAEVEAKQQEEAAAKKKQEEEAATKKRQEEEAAAAKKHQEEEAAKKKAEEEAVAKKRAEEAASKPPVVKTVTPKVPTKAQKLAKALRACKKEPKRKRARCEKQAHKTYGTARKKAGKRRK